jgi:hypothetical protein
MSSQEPSKNAPLVPALEQLTSRAGRYTGRGTNFEGHPFTAELEIKSRVSGYVIELAFKAKDDSSAFHEELTWISPDLETDRLCLYTVSTNTPGVLCHVLTDDRADGIRDRRLAFRLGNPEDKRTFRQEITLDLMKDGSLEYRYAWGVPHEEFGVRVQAVLQPNK